MNHWSKDKEFADTYLPQIIDILKDSARHIVDVVVAPYEDDVKRATDYIIEMKSGDVAARLRRDTPKKYRDWTIRSQRASGAKTELYKLKEGFARWYLYGWTLNGAINTWVLIDLDIVRKKDILSMKWTEKSNYDRVTKFIVIPIDYLITQKCIISSYNLFEEPNPYRPFNQTSLFSF